VLGSQICFWSSVLLILHVYVGYPLGIYLWAHRRNKRNGNNKDVGQTPGTCLPSITVLIPAHNEERWISQKIENALELEYPRDRVQVLVACDGCADATVAIARQYSDRGVDVFDYQPRSGKTATLNRAVPMARGEIVLLTDANALLTSDTASLLVSHFRDPIIGCVTGERVCLPTQGTATKGEGLYWRYEAWIKNSESLLGSCLGSHGQVMAIRKSLFREIPVIGDDFYIPMRMLITEKVQIRFEPRAKGLIPSAANLRLELERKIRSHVSLLRDLPYLRAGLNPFKSEIWWQFLSHHVLRLLVPFAMVTALLFAISLWKTSGLYRAMAVAQCVFYAAAAVGALLQAIGIRPAVVYIPFYFVFANAAVFLAWVRWARRRHQYAWQSTERILPQAPAIKNLRF
jgi:poly-beta-1,6-N-acetyl-D-glucosamine synthase